jgi:hypothetical protein
MIAININFIEISITVFLTVFFQSLFTHMITTRRIIEDIEKREQMQLIAKQRKENKSE